jgi:hypothetical protein
MAAEPVVSGNDNTIIGAGDFSADDFEPAPTEELVGEYITAPVVAYEGNNYLLAASEDSYPYNNQFEPEDTATGFGLHFDVNSGDQFNAFDANAPFSFDEFINYQYNLNLNGYMNTL